MNPIRKTGDIWSTVNNPNSLLLVTTNSILKKDGTLVMGAGIAKQAAERYPALPSIFGYEVRRLECEGGFYGLLVGDRKKVGAFQTKRDWRDMSLIADIQRSAQMLQVWLDSNPGYTANLPLPGCGHGGRDPEEVWPILDDYLDERTNVWVYK